MKRDKNLEEEAAKILRGELSENTRPTRVEVRQEAQKQIMRAATLVLYHVEDDAALSPEMKEAVKKEVPKQIKRVERIFGYVPGSWGLS